jgi:hypothetical protein
MPQRHLIPILSLALSAGLVLAACGDDDDNDSGASGGGGAAASATIGDPVAFCARVEEATQSSDGSNAGDAQVWADLEQLAPADILDDVAAVAEFSEYVVQSDDPDAEEEGRGGVAAAKDRVFVWIQSECGIEVG